MKSKMFKKLMAAVLATTMTVSLASCGPDTPADGSGDGTSGSDNKESTDQQPSGGDKTDESTASGAGDTQVGSYVPLTDANGNVYDLGGMDIIVRDWFSGSGERGEAKSDAEEATFDYQDAIMAAHNFTIKKMSDGYSDWGSAPQDFIDYASAPDDGQNFLFTVRACTEITNAMKNGLCFDLATLDCLDFSSEKFQMNKLHDKFSRGSHIFAMYANAPEPRDGIYFNKRLLKEADIDPESIFDMQKNGTWTWDAFRELCQKVHRDTDSDGQIDVYGCDGNFGNFVTSLIYANDGEYVGKDHATGDFILKLTDQNTIEALNFAKEIQNSYMQAHPADASWDYYQSSYREGKYVFMFEQGYAATHASNNMLSPDKMFDEIGFVHVPKGPASKGYTNLYQDNPVIIPANYSKEKAWNLAFAWNLFTNDTPGYENSDSWQDTYYDGSFDERSVNETIAPMRSDGLVSYHDVVPDLNTGDIVDHLQDDDVSVTVDSIKDRWQALIDAANEANKKF